MLASSDRRKKRASHGSPPGWIRPQLALLVKRTPDGPDWLHEIKYDGYRLHARIDADDIRLMTRNGLDWTHRYPAAAQALAALKLKIGLRAEAERISATRLRRLCARARASLGKRRTSWRTGIPEVQAAPKLVELGIENVANLNGRFRARRDTCRRPIYGASRR